MRRVLARRWSARWWLFVCACGVAVVWVAQRDRPAPDSRGESQSTRVEKLTGEGDRGAKRERCRVMVDGRMEWDAGVRPAEEAWLVSLCGGQVVVHVEKIDSGCAGFGHIRATHQPHLR